jgi:hypothetical protein
VQADTAAGVSQYSPHVFDFFNLIAYKIVSKNFAERCRLEFLNPFSQRMSAFFLKLSHEVAHVSFGDVEELRLFMHWVLAELFNVLDFQKLQHLIKLRHWKSSNKLLFSLLGFAKPKLNNARRSLCNHTFVAVIIVAEFFNRRNAVAGQHEELKHISSFLFDIIAFSYHELDESPIFFTLQRLDNVRFFRRLRRRLLKIWL